jgi:hypothetical protein
VLRTKEMTPKACIFNELLKIADFEQLSKADPQAPSAS